MGISIIFISSSSWADHVANGFRTRQGAILRQFSLTNEVDELIVVTETGFRGYSGYKCFNDASKVPITQIYVSGRLPQYIISFLGKNARQNNYVIPSEKFLPRQNALIWSYSIGLGLLIKKLSGAPLFYDVVDYRPNDANLPVWQRIIWNEELSDACRFADVVVCNGEIAFGHLDPQCKGRCQLVRNGVDVERFLTHRKNLVRQGVGYVGVLSQWIDFDLIKTLLTKMPDINFEFYGIVRSKSDRLAMLNQYKNFHWHGQIHPRDIPQFLSSCQVGIAPYNPEVTKRTQGDSMKVYEYLAAGTPVVCTRFQDGLEQKFQGLINISDDYAGFQNALQACLSNDPDIDWQEKAWEFVTNNSWQKRVQEIVSLADQIRTNTDRI